MAEESGQRAPPTQARSERSPKVSKHVLRAVSHLAQLPSGRSSPLAPQLQTGQQDRCKPAPGVCEEPRLPGTLNHSVCVKPAHTTVAAGG